MNELIRVNKNTNGEQLVKGRDLHAFLEVESKYIDWINRMIDYGFIENVDYIISIELSLKKEGSRNVKREIKEHILKISMAKEVCMIQRSDKGKEARLYFIKCEEQLKELSCSNVLQHQKDFYALQIAIDILKPNEGSKIKMIDTMCANHNVPTNFLPQYTEENLTKSLSELLKENNVILSPQKANVILEQEGIVEKKYRPSSKGQKAFWSLTEKGLKYGKNLISPHNQKQTQTHFYINKFEELIKIIIN